jgi:RNA polymerase sigma factor (sigma-70 family)
MEMRRRLPAPTTKDEQIIRSILDGKKNDYELLIRRYNERLFRIGISILKNDTEVEDSMQETYVKAYQQLTTFKGKSQFSTWLSRIMINECLLKLKRNKKHVEFTETESYSPFETSSDPRLSSTITPEKQLLQKELNTILENAIQQLPQKYQTVFMMREVEKMSIQETAECLKISTVNVKVRLHRAKELLRSQLNFLMPKTETFPFQDIRCDRIVHFVLGDARVSPFQKLS